MRVARIVGALWSFRSWPLLCGLAGSCASTYCAIGYIHYKHVAGDERVAAERAERANIDLQEALDRLREELALADARIETMSKAKPEIALSEQYKAEAVARLTRALERLDLNLTEPRPAAVKSTLSRGTSELAEGHLQLSWVSIGLDQSPKQLHPLSAARDDVVGERVSELEQELSLLQSVQAPRQFAKPLTDSIPGTTSGRHGSAAITFAGSGVVPATETSRPVLKNFTTPGSVPDHFSNENEAILERASPAGGEQR